MPKGENQKVRVFYVADYLMKYADDEHGVLMKDIRKDLKEKGIDAHEHSIGRDIAMLRDFFGMDICGGKGKPIYLCSRYIDFEDVRAIAECVASAKFLSEKEADALIEILKRLCSEYQATEISSKNIVVERPKYKQKDMLVRLSLIRSAIKENKKIVFYYTRRSMRSLEDIEKRRGGKLYSVSPFRIVLSEGNHYLVGYDDRYKRDMAFRIDRMVSVDIKQEPREKEKSDLDYARQAFGMFIGGAPKRFTLQFDNSLLDAVVERFGHSLATKYCKIDASHFSLQTVIVPSPIFYGWLCGFGDKAKIIEPSDEVERYKAHLMKIAEIY